MPKRLKNLGIFCVALGVSIVIVSVFSIKLALPLSIIGMLLSGLYVFWDTKDQVNTKTITPGIIGMILSSVPVLFILALIIYQYIKHS